MDYYYTNEALKYEKRAARRTGNFIGLGMLLLTAFNLVVSFAYSFLARFFPSLYELTDDAVFNYLYNAFVTVVGFIVGGIVLLKCLRQKCKEVMEFKKPTTNIIPLIFIGLGICMVANFVTSIFASFMSEFFNFTPKQPKIDTPTDFFGGSIYIITTAVLPALVEEFMYRGAIYGTLKKFGKPLAILLSAMLFGLMHGNLIQIPFAFIVGLGLGFITAESNSVWPAVIVHFLNNLMACIFDYVGIFFGEEISNIVFMIYLLLFIALGIIFAVIYFAKNNETAFKYEKTPHLSKSGRIFVLITFCPVLIVFYVETVLSIISAQLVA